MRTVLCKSDVIIGNMSMVDLVMERYPTKVFKPTPMTQEVMRCANSARTSDGGQKPLPWFARETGYLGMAALYMNCEAKALCLKSKLFRPPAASSGARYLEHR